MRAVWRRWLPAACAATGPALGVSVGVAVQRERRRRIRAGGQHRAPLLRGSCQQALAGRLPAQPPGLPWASLLGSLSKGRGGGASGREASTGRPCCGAVASKPWQAGCLRSHRACPGRLCWGRCPKGEEEAHQGGRAAQGAPAAGQLPASPGRQAACAATGPALGVSVGVAVQRERRRRIRAGGQHRAPLLRGSCQQALAGRLPAQPPGLPWASLLGSLSEGRGGGASGREGSTGRPCCGAVASKPWQAEATPSGSSLARPPTRLQLHMRAGTRQLRQRHHHSALAEPGRQQRTWDQHRAKEGRACSLRRLARSRSRSSIVACCAVSASGALEMWAWNSTRPVHSPSSPLTSSSSRRGPICRGQTACSARWAACCFSEKGQVRASIATSKPTLEPLLAPGQLQAGPNLRLAGWWLSPDCSCLCAACCFGRQLGVCNQGTPPCLGPPPGSACLAAGRAGKIPACSRHRAPSSWHAHRLCSAVGPGHQPSYEAAGCHSQSPSTWPGDSPRAGVRASAGRPWLRRRPR